ncbi:MAG: NAD(P)H-dependent oxidoreductase [Sphingomonas sp.]|uniref:FMN-dependent NADH-azoreductase n=1 Tax=Sphingomonas sp. TaxID=28214 RepID=UPI0022722E2C|nr:NAD(P)H-dependent oxidoreductase [Sphingomonas sp.]MCX8477512.1 NAD(P)H-dependent oxidoreductase [Sphingomonas sp.]
MKILHIDTSIQGEGSASRRISAEAVRRVLAGNPQAEVAYRDLAAEPLAHLTLGAFASADSQAALAEFQAADVVVIGTGMYNFSVPSQLKAWIDRVLVAGQTFRYTETGPEGLAGGKRVIIALARGGFYGDGSPAAFLEHAETYLRGVFAFIGVRDVEFVTADGTAIPDAREAAIEAAQQRAAALAA